MILSEEEVKTSGVKSIANKKDKTGNERIEIRVHNIQISRVKISFSCTGSRKGPV